VGHGAHKLSLRFLTKPIT